MKNSDDDCAYSLIMIMADNSNLQMKAWDS